MGERGVTVLAAVLGLLGGMAGAAVGGYVANEGQQQRFEHERATDTRARLADSYVRFVRAAETEFADGPGTEDLLLRTAAAEVSLATSQPDIRRTAHSLVLEAFDGQDAVEYQRLADEFVRRAQAEMAAVE
jgi:hypothetical protein